MMNVSKLIPIQKNIIKLLIMLSALPAGSCKKFIEVDVPYTSLNGNNVYTTDATAISAVTSMYVGMGQGVISSGIPSVSYFCGLSADELTLFTGYNSQPTLGAYRNELTASSPLLCWSDLYQILYLANAAIEGLNSSTSLTPAVKQQLLGEAKFMRAFCYFYLVNLYGDVPLVISSDYKLNSLKSRSPASNVWQQIISDLLEAVGLLNTNYVASDVVTATATTERVRPNKWAASALLARAYLYIGEYAKAESESTEIINNNLLFGLSTLNNAFLKDPALNKEAIWQLQGVITGWNTNDARGFILPSSGPNTTTFPVYISKRLQFNFEASDLRKTAWMDSVKIGTDTFYYAHKYKIATLNAPVTEYNVVFRLSEQYLIRAEARTKQNNLTGAIDDLDKIRSRAGLPLIATTNPGISQSALIDKILHERQVELFTEWGHRWLDLKRTNNVDAVMSIETPLKGGIWQPTDKYYPISNDELIRNPNLTQTPGY